MIIKVIGIGRPNRGAELMLAAIHQYFDGCQVESIVVESTISDNWSRWRSKFNRVFGFYMPGSIDWVFKVVPFSVRISRKWLTDSDVDVFIDASGFGYGDKWGVEKLKRRLALDLPRWKKAGKKVILLPQAFGPFTKSGFGDAVTTVVELSDLVFARDQESYMYLESITGPRSNVVIRPDFTNLISVQGLEPPLGEVAIIPNSKMLEMGEVDSLKQYVDVMVCAIECVRRHGKKVFLINHEGERDRSVIDSINASLTVPLEVFETENPIEIKAAIKTTQIVIGSRFHGLVSALSQGVPVIAMGWSHKYKELLAEYGVSSYLIEVDSVAIQRVINELMDDGSRTLLSESISGKAEQIKELTEDMWRRVDELIFSKR